MESVTLGAVALMKGLIRAMPREDQLAAISMINQEFGGEKTQICGYCMTAYQEAGEAAECADRCSGRQRLVTSETETRRSSGA